jgi:hypothetical protein
MNISTYGRLIRLQASQARQRSCRPSTAYCTTVEIAARISSVDCDFAAVTVETIDLKLNNLYKISLKELYK